LTTATEPTDQYLRTFNWDKIRYRTDRPLGELIENLQKEIANIDNDVRSKFNQYNSVKTNLAVLKRKQTYACFSGPMDRLGVAFG
jgi:V-type H+-transporting ATPase subunit C